MVLPSPRPALDRRTKKRSMKNQFPVLNNSCLEIVACDLLGFSEAAFKLYNHSQNI